MKELENIILYLKAYKDFRERDFLLTDKNPKEYTNGQDDIIRNETELNFIDEILILYEQDFFKDSKKVKDFIKRYSKIYDELERENSLK